MSGFPLGLLRMAEIHIYLCKLELKYILYVEKHFMAKILKLKKCLFTIGKICRTTGSLIF